MTVPFFTLALSAKASCMIEAHVLDGMTTRFPTCRFEVKRTSNPDFRDLAIPMMGTVNFGVSDEVVFNNLPDGLRAAVSEAFSALLREARERSQVSCPFTFN